MSDHPGAPSLAARSRFMTRALRLARRGVGRVSPNPPVGAVVVRNGHIVGEGWHGEYGGAHAEVEAIRSAPGEDACRGADLYVTLEPCGHQGKTPPCAEAIVRAGLRRVFYAIEDPNPDTAGVGPRYLRTHGLEIDRGLGADAARRLIAPYLCRLRTGRPLVTSKWAMTADGRIATATGNSQWISAPATRTRTRKERSGYDAILVGRGTVTADDPRLTSRTPGRRNPLRVVLDSELRLDPGSALVRSVEEADLLVACAPSVADDLEARRNRLKERGVEVLEFPPDAAGRVPIDALLETLGQRGVCHLLVEGGPRIHGSFHHARRVDRVQIILAPILVGGAEAPGPIGGPGAPRIDQGVIVQRWRIIDAGPDRILEGDVTDAARGA